MGNMAPSAYVLQKFSPKEREEVSLYCIFDRMYFAIAEISNIVPKTYPLHLYFVQYGKRPLKMGPQSNWLGWNVQLGPTLERGVEGVRLLTTEGLQKTVSTWNLHRKSRIDMIN